MRRKSLFTRYFLSYLFVGFILILSFGVVFFYFNVVSLDAEVRTNHFSTVSQSLNKVDYMLESMSNIAYHFSTGEFLSEAEGSSESFLADQLESYEQNMSVESRIAFYRRGDTHIYLRDGRYEYLVFERTLGEGADYTMSQLFSTLNSCNRATAVRVLPKADAAPEASTPSAAFIYPIPYMSRLPQMSLAFFVSADEFYRIFENYAGTQRRNLYLLDASLQTVYTSQSVPLSEEERLSLIRMKGTGVFDLTLRDTPMVAMRALSDNSGYSLIVTMEAGDFFSRVGLMRSVVSMCVALFLLLTLILAFFLAFRSVRPIRALMRSTVEEGDEQWPKNDPEGNELDILESHIQKTRREKQELDLLLDQQRPYIVHTCISNLLRGKVQDPEELRFQMRCASITFSRPFLQVLLITPMGKEGLGEKIQTILAACAQLPLADAALYCAEIILEKQVAAILNCAQAEEGGVSTGLFVARKLREALSAYDCEVSIGVGLAFDAIDGIHTSLVQAMVVTSEYLPNHPGHVMSFADIPEPTDVEYTISFTDQSMLLQALKQGDQQVALQSLDRMLTRVSESSGSFLITQYQCFDIANTLIKTVSQMDGDLHRIDLHELGNFKNLGEFGAQARAIVEEICRQYDTLKEQKNNALSNSLIQYVLENYRNSELSLEQMASFFELSPSYLSRFFKQATGRTFIQYVTLLRLDYVRDQLARTDTQIKEIVTQAGYIDTPSFVRKFKAIEGLTPGQYRQAIREAAQGAKE